LIVLADVRLAEQLLALEDFAVKAHDSPDDIPLPTAREEWLALIARLRLAPEPRIEAKS
jgi:hypothetical protein